MSVTRRQFLLSTAGAAVGAIVPSFYHQALQFLEQFGEPLLVAPPRPTLDLCVLDLGDYVELCLGDPYAEPPELTFREFFARYEPEGFETFAQRWGLGPEGLELPVDTDYQQEMWSLRDGPSAEAYYLLDSLDLGTARSGRNGVGGIDFVEEWNMAGWNWIYATPRDEVSLSLLQQRLNDLGTGIRVVTGYTI
jgi:hypothetical protein